MTRSYETSGARETATGFAHSPEVALLVSSGRVGLVRRGDPAAGRDSDVVLSAALAAAELGADVDADMDAGIVSAGADTPDPHGLADRTAHLARSAPIDLAADALDARVATGREPTALVAFVGVALGNQSPRCQVTTGDGPDRHLYRPVGAVIASPLNRTILC